MAEKAQIYPVFILKSDLRSFVAIYALLCGEKIVPKISYVEKSDKYQIWVKCKSLEEQCEVDFPELR